MPIRLVFISDTHQLDPEHLPEGDVLIHSGDWCGSGPISKLKAEGDAQLAHFCKQLRSWQSRFQKTIVIAGNHDFIAESQAELTRDSIEDTGSIYLNDSGFEFQGISFWGSPIQPWYLDWAFNKSRGEEIRRHWDLIPQHTDVLITHGPPYGILDRIYSGERPSVGCEELLAVVENIAPKIHAFGHIHEGYGEYRNGKTHFINAATLNEFYAVQNPAIIVDL